MATPDPTPEPTPDTSPDPAHGPDDLRRTPLHDHHVAADARMVDFAGWSMPVSYDSALDEHLHTRAAAGLFDVGHMLPIDLLGDGAAAALEALTPSSVTSLAPGRSRYLVLTNDRGGVIDDLIATRLADDHVRVVANAARADVDLDHLTTSTPDDVEVRARPDLGVLALQGPAAAAVLADLGEDIDDLHFLDGRPTTLGDPAGDTPSDAWLSRGGYTGEDGIEVIADGPTRMRLADALLADDRVRWVGLAARDSLRLEAGLCLYGNDLDEDTTPIEAGLFWTIPKAARSAPTCPGGDVLAAQVADGPPRRLVGLTVNGRRPVRPGAALSRDGNQVGVVSSGGWGATVDAPVAMGYVTGDHPTGTGLVADVRGRDVAVTVAALPHVPHHYRR